MSYPLSIITFIDVMIESANIVNYVLARDYGILQKRSFISFNLYLEQTINLYANDVDDQTLSPRLD